MKPETIFQICNSIAPIGWLLLVVAPRWKWTTRIVLSGIFPLLLAVVYFFLIVFHFGDGEGDFSSLQGVTKLFENPFALVAGWVHYLAFDLVVGSWILVNSQKHQIHHLIIIPCLLLTFLFGPIGFLVYVIVRGLKTKQLLHENF